MPQSDCKCSYLLAKKNLLWPPKVTSPNFSLWFISSSFVSVCNHTTVSSSLSPLLAGCHFWAIKFPELLLNIVCDTWPTPAPAARREMAREWAKAHPRATSESQPAAGMPRSLQKCCEFGAFQGQDILSQQKQRLLNGEGDLDAWGSWGCLGFWKIHEISALVWQVRFCPGPASAPTRAVCVLSRQGPGQFLKKMPQLPGMHIQWFHRQVHLSIQCLDCTFVVLVSLWRGDCFRSTECKRQGGSQILDLHTLWIKTARTLGHFLYWFPLLPSWIVQPELFTSLLQRTSHESKSWHCSFPLILGHFNLGSSLFSLCF